MKWTSLSSSLCALVLAAGGAQAQDAVRLDCQVTYAGATQTVTAHPVEDPYSVAPVDIGGRFGFKPVVVGKDGHVQRVSLYVYFFKQGESVLIQQAKYLPPYHPAQSLGGFGLTGEQRLYAGNLERELIYGCTLQGVRP